MNKMTSLNNLLYLCNNIFSIIGVTETWLSDSNQHLIDLPNFKFVCKNRHDKVGGGVGIFIHNSLKYIVRDDLNINSFHFESLIIEIFLLMVLIFKYLILY